MMFRQLEPRPQGALPGIPYDRWLSENGETVTEFHRTARGFIIRFIDNGDFTLETGEWSVTCTPVPEASSRQMREIYSNQIVPLVLGYQGELVLHASGVAAKAGALGFVGPTGRGKSTLAAAFAREGHPFLTDDGLILDRIGDEYHVRPNNPSCRLREDSEAVLFGNPADRSETERQGKRRIASGRSLPFQKTPVPLRTIYLLGTGAAQATEIVRLRPAAALSALIGHSFILDVEDRQRVRRHFDRIAELARTVRCFTLDFPRDYAYLSKAMDAILDHASCEGIAT